jgi:hypothetical protein
MALVRYCHIVTIDASYGTLAEYAQRSLKL